ncbi:gastrula zinc finger protein XlCGF57.1-like isoform X9 [Leptidea sinapis]|uniref:gastrula zinc finger protein XlCGF57.1-like isoform X9 n=1 Tax=Leptidea sinapis TaxID=189913 RepID=UPI0021C38620|nr:gastrula zinc finger protein XlCGF57.1-like isoform X9 [Leptidea sinapis]
MDGKSSNWRPGPSVCRCCLSDGCYKDIATEYFWMGKREVYEEMLVDTLGLTISFGDSNAQHSQSRLICETCISRLRNATDFKKQVKECEQTFLQYLNPSTLDVVEDVISLEKEEKQVTVKEEKSPDHGDDFNDNNDFLDDDNDDELDDQPLMNLATKVPKKESVDVFDLLDNAKPLVKRKSTTKAKTTSSKKAKIKETKTKPKEKPEKKKKENQQLSTNMVARRSAEAVLKYSTVCPFRVRRSELCCVYCFDEFQSGAEFKQHMDTNHRLFNVSTAFSHCSTANEYLKVDCSDLRCRVCSEIFNSIEEIARHLHDIHDVRKINPDHKIFLQPYKIDDDNWVCVICNKRMPSLTKLCRHTTSHYQKFTCDICGRSYLTNEALKYHVRCNHSGSQYTCRKCWQEFLTDEEKKHHVQTSKQCWPFCCVHCCEKFKSWEGKQKHLEDVHGKPKKKYNCTDCNEVFESRKQFYSHYTLYHTNDSFMCTCCGMKFTKKHKLEDHKITHTGEKDFECDICNKLFTRKNTLKQHMYIHKVVKRFPCPVCNKQFAQKVSLKRHASSYHPDISFEL